VTDTTETEARRQWNEIVTFWAHGYVLRCDPAAPAGKRYSARPAGEDAALYAATPGALLDAIKDDASARRSFPEGRCAA
jgi:hypothetical protein